MTNHRHHPPPPYVHQPLDYVPTGPVYKPRRTWRRSIKAAACAAVATAIGVLAPFALAAMLALAVGWWAFCELMARRRDGQHD